MKTERLYLSTSEYNTALMLDHLKDIVIENGGTVLKNQYTDKYILSNRTIHSIMLDLTATIEKLEALEAVESKDIRKKALEAKKAELKKYQSINNEPITLYFRNYMYFIFDNYYYYVSFDDNPFFPAHYMRIRIDDNYTYTGDYYIDELEKKDTILYNIYKTGADVKENAVLLFDTLINSSISKKYRNGKKVRVYNLYNSGYHYETIYEKEKTHSIDTSLIINK